MSKILKALAVVGDGYGNKTDLLAVASTNGSQLAVFTSAPPAADALKFKGEVVLRVVIMPEEDYEARNARYDRLQQRLTAADQQIDDFRAALATNPKPDPVLCKFYDVTDWPSLVRELVGHVAQLQDSAKRNIKPWEDTFPPTLLPAYIKRVNAANTAAQPQGEPVAWTEVDVLDFMSVALRHAEYSGLAPSDILDGLRYMAEKGKPAVVRPAGAPVAVAPERLVMTDGLHTYEYVTGHNAAIDKMLGVKS